MEQPQNSQFWQKIAKHPEAVQKSFWYGAKDLATFLGDEPQLYQTYLKYDQSKPSPDWPWWKKIVFYYSQSEYNQTINQHNMVVSIQEKSSWIYGVLQGDFNKNPTLSQILVGGVISLIPVVDQVCDIRDLISNLVTLSDEKDQTPENYMALSLTAIGLIPELGSILKTTVKSIQAKATTKLSLMKTMESLETAAYKVGGACPWGRSPERWLRSQPWAQVAKDAYRCIKSNIERLTEILTHYVHRATGIFKQKIAQLINTLSQVGRSIEKYIQQLCENVRIRVTELLPQPRLAMAGHPPPKGMSNTPTNRYEVNTAGAHPTQVRHQQKEEKPERDKTKENSKDDTCILRPYKPDTCKPKGKTGHHVVPDRCFRLGTRKGSGRGQIDGGLTEAEGLVVCVKGPTPKPDNEHGQIHAIHRKLENELKKILVPTGSGPLAEVEVICAKSIVSIIKKCDAAKLAIQLRTYHQSKGLDPNFVVRIDEKGTAIKKLPANIYGPKT